MTTVIDLLYIADLCLKLGEVRRATKHKNGERETDTTHSFMLALVVKQLAQDANLDVLKAIQYALVHDLVEAYAGDVCTLRPLRPEERKQKDTMEAYAATTIGRNLPWAMDLIYQYEAQEDLESQLVHYADKMMPSLTHILNNGSTLKELGTTSEELAALKAEAKKKLDIKHPSPVLDHVRDLFDQVTHRATLIK